MTIQRKAKLESARFDALSQVSRVISSALDPQRIVEVALHTVGALMEGMVVQLWQLHEEDKSLILLGSHGWSRTDADKTQSIPMGQGVVGRAAATRSPISIENLRVDPYGMDRQVVEQEGLISFLGVPLIREEKLFGVLSILTRTRHHFSQNEIALLDSFAQQVTMALENAYRYQELQRSYQELSAARAKLVRETRMTTIGEMANAISHDARNFLGALRTCVQILQSNPQLAGRDAELLDIIHDGSQWFAEIISQISALGESRSPHFEEVDLHELIDETFALLHHHEQCPPSVVIRREFDPSLEKILGDRDHLVQVFRNLFLNAIQAMEGQGELQVETHRIDSQVKILIRDTGTGIVPTVLPHIFEPFHSTKSGHCGLGLAIVRRIVEEHGGQITVDSEQQKGACFVMMLPLELKRN